MTLSIFYALPCYLGNFPCLVWATSWVSNPVSPLAGSSSSPISLAPHSHTHSRQHFKLACHDWDTHLHFALGHVSRPPARYLLTKMLGKPHLASPALDSLDNWRVPHLCISFNSNNGFSPFTLGWVLTYVKFGYNWTRFGSITSSCWFLKLVLSDETWNTL